MAFGVVVVEGEGLSGVGVGVIVGVVVSFGGGAEVAKAVRDGVWKAEDFRDFAEGGAGAVGDDVCGHGGAVGGVFFIDVLDDGFAALAGGEVDVDVGP